MRRSVIIAISVIVGLVVAGIASSLIIAALNSGYHSSSSVTPRYPLWLEVEIILITTAVRLIDPIHDVIALIFGGLAYAVMVRIWPASPKALPENVRQ